MSAALRAPVHTLDHRKVDWSAVARSEYHLHQSFRYEYGSPARHLHQRLLVLPPDVHGDQRTTDPVVEVTGGEGVDLRHLLDRFGNHVVEVDILRVDDAVTFDARARVERSRGPRPAVPGVWLSHPTLRRPTRLTRPDAAIAAAADLLVEHVGPGAGPLEIAEAASSWAHRALRYRYGTTGVGTTAAAALDGGVGVCQDHAHLLLAVLRRLGIACRYVSGHLLGEGATHAWTEVLVPHPERPGWAEAHALDPCNDRRAGLEYVTVAVGRDYADVAPTSGWFEGDDPGSLHGGQTIAVLAAELA